MGIFSGAADQVDTAKAAAVLEPFLIKTEEIYVAFKVGRDIHAITNFRFLSLDVQGVTGSKKRLRTIPWHKVSAFEIESAGAFDADAELSLWVATIGKVSVRLAAETPVPDVQRVLAVMTVGTGDGV